MVPKKHTIAWVSYEDIEEHTAFIKMVANQLTRNFVLQMSQLCNRKCFFAHAGILSEMFEWSLEFFELYYIEFENLSEPADVEEAVIAFGCGKFNSLFDGRHYLDTYFINRYENDFQSKTCA